MSVASATENAHTPGRADRMRRERREQILAAAKEVFAERGYHNASINDIIGRAGIARGTFYLYFESKHKVFESILEEALHALRSRIKRIDVSEGAEPPQVQLRGSLVRVMQFVLEDPHFSRLLISHSLASDEEAVVQVNSFYAHVLALIASSLQHGIDMGLVRRCDTALVAAALLGAVRGIIDHCLVADEAPDIESIVDELLVFVLRGVVGSSRW